MIRHAYDLLLGLGVGGFLPRLLCKKKGALARAYLGGDLPPSSKSNGPIFLVYAVSVGEVRAADYLISSIKERDSTSTVYLAVRTPTGLAEGKNTLADYTTFLPFDFSFLMRRFLQRINPSAVFVMEGDLWYNMLKLSKERGAFTALVSGKVSERSYKRYQCVPFFSRPLFSLFDLVLAQDGCSEKRFAALGATKVKVAGNIKQANIPLLLEEEQKHALCLRLKIASGERVVVIGSTHDPEEKMVIEKLQTESGYKVLLAPRHPERFSEVEALLKKSGISYGLYGNLASLTGNEQVILINAMGALSKLYQVADIAVVGGSFAPHLQGHNILEPIFTGTLTFFGPHMSSQENIVEKVLQAQSAKQVTFEEIFSEMQYFFQHKEEKALFQERGRALAKEARQAGKRSSDPLFAELATFIKKQQTPC